MVPTLAIPQLHLEYRLWTNELSFNKEEIRIFEHHLEELVAKNTNPNVRAQIEQYQNKFIRQKEVIDELKHHLHVAEKQLAAFVKEMSGMGLSSIKMDNHARLREDMKMFRNLYNDLKQDFRRFEAVWL